MFFFFHFRSQAAAQWEKLVKSVPAMKKLFLGPIYVTWKMSLGKNQILTIYIATMGIFPQNSDFSIRAIVLKILISKFRITLKMWFSSNSRKKKILLDRSLMYVIYCWKHIIWARTMGFLHKHLKFCVQVGNDTTKILCFYNIAENRQLIPSFVKK